MATIKGQNLRVFLNNVVIAAAQQCQLNVKLDVKQISTKDDTDDFAKNIALKLSWSVSANGVVTVDPDRNDPSTLMDRIGQTVRVELLAHTRPMRAFESWEALAKQVDSDKENARDWFLSRPDGLF